MNNSIDLNKSFNKLKTEIMNDNLREQIVNISKAGAFDILTENYSKLKRENERLMNIIGHIDENQLREIEAEIKTEKEGTL